MKESKKAVGPAGMQGGVQGVQKRAFLFSKKDTALSALIFALALALCLVLQQLDESASYSMLIFELAVFLTARYTRGYFYGLAAALLGVVCTNYIFTYPYWTFNFSRTGYPLTFLCMTVVALLTSTMTTRIKRQEQWSAQMQVENMRANLLRAISHDIRTPLTSIIGAADLIVSDRDGSAGDVRALAQSIREDGRWLLQIAENLLSITRAGEGAALSKEAEVAEEILGESAAKFSKRYPGVAVDVSAPEEVLLVPMDALLIEQVLCNLLENAVEHGENTAHIALGVLRQGENALFFVEDDGAGIRDEALPYLFQGGEAAARGADRGKKRNMGIGLSVCRTIVRAHGGELTGENRQQGGARFAFTLPLDRAHEDAHFAGGKA